MHNGSPLIEALEVEAVQIFESAKHLCSGGLVDREDCSWYHGAWPLLRILGLVSNPYWHYSFFERFLSPRRTGRFLVLGTADISTPFLLHSLGARNVDVTDICPTPLSSCSRISSELGCNWRTFGSDALRLSEDVENSNYDTVVNDAFLTRFTQPEKIAVLEGIRRTLMPGGLYVSTARVDGSGRNCIGPGYQSSHDRRRYFVERAVARFIELGGVRGFTSDDVRSLASGYMRSMQSYRFDGEHHLVETLANAGFRTVFTERETTPGESEETDYIRFVAEIAP